MSLFELLSVHPEHSKGKESHLVKVTLKALSR